MQSSEDEWNKGLAHLQEVYEKIKAKMTTAAIDRYLNLVELYLKRKISLFAYDRYFLSNYSEELREILSEFFMKLTATCGMHDDIECRNARDRRVPDAGTIGGLLLLTTLREDYTSCDWECAQQISKVLRTLLLDTIDRAVMTVRPWQYGENGSRVKPTATSKAARDQLTAPATIGPVDILDSLTVAPKLTLLSWRDDTVKCHKAFKQRLLDESVKK